MHNTSPVKRINNKYLDLIKACYRKHFQDKRSKQENKVKIYEEDNCFVLQVKNTYTKQQVRFEIFKVQTDIGIIKVEFKDRNPNTVEFFDKPFTVINVINITEEFQIGPTFDFAVEFLYTPSKFSQHEFTKIKTVNDVKDLNENNLLVKKVMSILYKEDRVEITLKDFNFPFTILMSKKHDIRIPFVGDNCFINKEGRFQTQSVLKSNFNYELQGN